jgi:hypothetical protein
MNRKAALQVAGYFAERARLEASGGPAAGSGSDPDSQDAAPDGEATLDDARDRANALALGLDDAADEEFSDVIELDGDAEPSAGSCRT